ncbi:NAD(P)H-dependent oxidoreductase [Clostridium sp. YIM B02551]|uniref:NAD(P)H-dependent oxidoreductase n=1 Tax=Clostridium sp. YIM B02551 TaxID=2910679 RepID=UPI001EEA452D|nr:NAD(P)H-dependent oxidoreductase [Clostridium sp. YIM B02551]
MNILLVSDGEATSSVGEKLQEELLKKLRESNYNYKYYNVKDEKMNKCIGCFNCWLKTPGICVFDDITREISRTEINSDLYIVLSEIKYGCYSPKIKRVLDRGICKILPFFKDVNGEMHHAPRYEKYPELVFVGYGRDITANEEETFKGLNQANAINFQKDNAESYVCRDAAEIENLVNSILSYIKVVGEEI